MSVQGSMGPLGSGPGAMFAYVTEWAAQFHDSSSPPQVTDVLVSFSFLVGVNFGAGNPPVSAAFLRQMEKEQPSANRKARQLAKAMLDSQTESAAGKPRSGLTEFSPFTG